MKEAGNMQNGIDGWNRKKRAKKRREFELRKKVKKFGKENIQNCKYFEVVEKYGAILFDFHC